MNLISSKAITLYIRINAKFHEVPQMMHLENKFYLYNYPQEQKNVKLQDKVRATALLSRKWVVCIISVKQIKMVVLLFLEARIVVQ